MYIIHMVHLCKIFPVLKQAPHQPCNPSPCGPNAVCRERNGAGSCVCLDDFYGDPYVGCRPECVMNTDCTRDKSCFNNKCVDPCSGSCGQNTECRVTNHAPSCYCLPGYSGNPLHACTSLLSKTSFFSFCCIFLIFHSKLTFLCILLFFFSSIRTHRSVPSISLRTI